MKKPILTIIATFAFVLIASNQASAQKPAQYYPAKPTFSPYLFYNQFNGTGLPNYYTFVRPRQIYNDYVSRSRPSYYAEAQRQSLITQQDVTQIVDNQIRERLTTGIGQASQAATFQNTSHFFPQPVTRRR